ncbi:hypothetical protein WMY93_032130 [Mugilogobius chulae]|uniref:Uncharacterized protein n=1 Tax=Mugilogobius chulae TaxID=88201 RepID=A0AAW0ME84_9GOBI
MSLGSLSSSGGTFLSVLEEFQSQKNRLDSIARKLKNIRDRTNDRRVNVSHRVRREQENGVALGILAGAVLAPVTGGLSLAAGATVAAGVGAGVAVGVAGGVAVGGVSIYKNVGRVYADERRRDADDRDEMRTLLHEFQVKVKSMRFAVKLLRRYFRVHRLDAGSLVAMETMINELIEEIDTSSSLESLSRVSAQCKRVLNRLEETLEDVQVELFFRSQDPRAAELRF